MMTVFQIDRQDNVATALESLWPGRAELLGDTGQAALTVVDSVPTGHKIALTDLETGAAIIKYGVVIGRAVKPIGKGCWVHLHNICSNYDERSAHLDPVTGAPADTIYE